MKFSSSMCIAAAGLLGGALIVSTLSQDRSTLVGHALAQPGKPPPTFEVYACNKSTRSPVYLATVGVEGDMLHAKGWTNLTTQPTCQKAEENTRVGVFGRPSFWWYASDGEAYWEDPKAEKVQICVNLNENFDYAWDGKARDCKTGEQLVTFYERKVKDTSRVEPIAFQ